MKPVLIAKQPSGRAIEWLACLAALCLLLPGCVTRAVNPAKARANTGYLDIYARPPEDLCWEISRFDARAAEFRPFFSQYEPPPGGVLRLPLTPGIHRLRITLVNRVVTGPAELEVRIEDGRITPVEVLLSGAGSTQILTKTTSVDGTLYGRSGRRTKFGSYEATSFRLAASPQPPRPYAPLGTKP